MEIYGEHCINLYCHTLNEAMLELIKEAIERNWRALMKSE